MRFGDRTVLALLGSALHPLLGDSLVGLEVTGRRTGRRYRFPVSASPSGERLVVLPGHAERKQWWRNLGGEAAVRVLRERRWQPARAQVLTPSDPEWPAARAAYAATHPGVPVAADAPLVVVTPTPVPVPERNPS